MNKLSLIALACVSASLVGCARSTDDLDAWMKSEGSKLKGQVTALPPVAPFVPTPYAGLESPDPFAPKRNAAVSANAPDENRKKEFLEGFPLDKLKMVGLIKRKNLLVGLVRSPDGNVNMVQSGNYMGQNYGRIADITEMGMLLKESVQDAQGAWVERDVPVEISEGAAK